MAVYGLCLNGRKYLAYGFASYTISCTISLHLLFNANIDKIFQDIVGILMKLFEDSENDLNFPFPPPAPPPLNPQNPPQALRCQNDFKVLLAVQPI